MTAHDQLLDLHLGSNRKLHLFVGQLIRFGLCDHQLVVRLGFQLEIRKSLSKVQLTEQERQAEHAYPRFPSASSSRLVLRWGCSSR